MFNAQQYVENYASSFRGQIEAVLDKADGKAAGKADTGIQTFVMKCLLSLPNGVKGTMSKHPVIETSMGNHVYKICRRYKVGFSDVPDEKGVWENITIGACSNVLRDMKKAVFEERGAHSSIFPLDCGLVISGWVEGGGVQRFMPVARDGGVLSPSFASKKELDEFVNSSLEAFRKALSLKCKGERVTVIVGFFITENLCPEGVEPMLVC